MKPGRSFYTQGAHGRLCLMPKYYKQTNYVYLDPKKLRSFSTKLKTSRPSDLSDKFNTMREVPLDRPKSNSYEAIVTDISNFQWSHRSECRFIFELRNEGTLSQGENRVGKSSTGSQMSVSNAVSNEERHNGFFASSTLPSPSSRTLLNQT